MLPRSDSLASVYSQCLARDPTSVLARKEENAAHNVLRRAEPFERDILNEPALSLLAVGFPLPFGRGIRSDETGSHVIHRDAPAPKFVRQLSRQSDLPRLS